MTRDNTGKYRTAPGETLTLRTMLLEQCGSRPRSAVVLFERVRDEWGEVSERRLWRALRWLAQRGDVAPVNPQVSPCGVRWHSEGYVRVQRAVAS